MILTVENIGIIKHATVKLKGITLIAGQNDSGKSTIGKILHALIKGINVYENEDKLYFSIGEFLKNFYDNIRILLSRMPNSEKEHVFLNFFYTNDLIINTTITSFQPFIRGNFDFEERKQNLNKTLLFLNELKLKLINKNDFSIQFNKLIDEAINFLEQKNNSFEVINYETLKCLEEEFGGKILNVFSDGIGKILIDNRGFEITRNGKLELKNNEIKELPFKDVVFIESPLSIFRNHFFKDESNTRDKNTLLDLKLIQKPDLNYFNNNENAFNQFQKILNEIIDGNFEHKDIKIIYNRQGQEFGMNSTATGVKSFGILQMLLKNNVLKPSTLLILDEPEVHLHPQWQVKYAELIVRLSKELNFTILLTSHSPYFIEAIEGFSKKYNFENNTNFYLANKTENCAEIIDVTKNLLPIHDTIFAAFEKIRELNE
jgi:predicted ATPase